MAQVQKVEVVNQRPNHLLHLVLAVITCGLWIPVWVAMTGIANLKQVEAWSDDAWRRVIIALVVMGVAIYFAL